MPASDGELMFFNGLEDFPMKCPVCHSAELIHDTRDLQYTYKGASTVILAVTADWCPACGESITSTPETGRVMKAMVEFNRKVDASTE